MRFAVNDKGFVTNVIVARPEQKEELEQALGVILEDASIYGLTIGDMWVEGKGWTRNRDGEQYTLEILPEEDWVQYQALADENESLQTTLDASITPREMESMFEKGVNSIDA